MITLVTTAYKIPESIIETFRENNGKYNIILVSDNEKYATIPCPEMEIFSITRTSNLGIKYAILNGFDIIIKTDIDCIISETLVNFCERIKENQAYFFQYWQLKNDEKWLDQRCIGTVCMTAKTWASCMFNDLFEGYGLDDGELFNRSIRQGIHAKIVDNPACFHLWHEKHNPEINPENRINNRISIKNSKNIAI